MYVKTVTRTRTLVAKRQRWTGTCELRFHVVSLNFPNLELRNLTKLGICLLPSIMTRRLRRKMMLWTNVKPLRPISSAITLRTTGHSGFYRRRTHCGRYARGSFVRWAASSFTEHGRRRLRTPSSSLSSVVGEIVGESIATPLHRQNFYSASPAPLHAPPSACLACLQALCLYTLCLCKPCASARPALCTPHPFHRVLAH